METKKGIHTAARTKALVRCALGAALICVCAWITIPGPVPFTLQTFAVACVLGLLGGRAGTVSILCYILLGALGLPVFSGFSGGIGRLLGATGGYILGFLGMGLVYWAAAGRSLRVWRMAAGMIAGLFVCYLFGTIWFVRVYTGTQGPMSYAAALGLCVWPFLPFDALKLASALTVSRMLAPRLRQG